MDEYRTFRFASAIPWYVMLPAAIMLVVFAIHLYRTERKMVSRPMGIALTSLRALLPVLLILMLLEPLFSVHWFTRAKSRVILLLDGSLSMQATDENRSPAEKIRLADALGMLPENIRTTEYAKLAAEADAIARQLNDAAQTAEKLAQQPQDAEAEHERIHTQLDDASDALGDFAEKLKKFLKSDEQKHPEEIRKQLQTALTSLEKQANAYEKVTDRDSSNKTDLLAWPSSSFGAIEQTAAALRTGQLAADTALAQSGIEMIASVLEELNKMPRREVMERLLAKTETGILPKFSGSFAIDCYQLKDHGTNRIAAESGEDIDLQADGKITDLAEAVKFAAEKTQSAGDAAAVVLLTDGQNNSGGDPETAARILAGNNVPLYTIGIGSGQPPRDIAIAELDTSRVIYLGDEVHVGAVVKYDGYQGTALPLVIEEGDSIVTQKRVTFPADRRRLQDDLAFIPKTVGTHKYSIRVPLQKDELIENNNRREFAVKVIDKKIKVLYVEGEPRWEYRFLKNLLLRDKTIELNRLMLPRDAEALPRGEKNGAFPSSKAELFRYEVLIIGDIPADRFFPSDLKNIQAFAAENGGAVVFVAGPLFNPASYIGTPVEELLPVEPTSGPAENIAKEIKYAGFSPVLTQQGEASPITRLSFDRIINAEIWRNLPPLHWQAFLNSPKPGAEVLLRAPRKAGQQNIRENGSVLLATQHYGMGKALLLATDDTWRWRWKVGDKYFHKFWGQILRWATAGKSAGQDRYIRMGTQKQDYDEGEPVEFQAKVFDRNLKPLNRSQVVAVLQQDEKPVQFFTLEYVQGSEGRYRGTFRGLKKGRYTIRLDVPALPQNPSEANVEIRVADRPDLEQVELYLNRPLLESMSQATGGTYYPAADYDKLFAAVKPSSKRIPQVEEIRLWSWPGFLVLFTLVACAEWALRKKAGLM